MGTLESKLWGLLGYLHKNSVPTQNAHTVGHITSVMSFSLNLLLLGISVHGFVFDQLPQKTKPTSVAFLFFSKHLTFGFYRMDLSYA